MVCAPRALWGGDVGGHGGLGGTFLRCLPSQNAGEPPLTKLMAAGPVTPAALHYVRNHGACPRAGWDTHRVTVSAPGAADRAWTMDELAALPSATLPVLLVCAGNRRKEQNSARGAPGGGLLCATAAAVGADRATTTPLAHPRPRQ